MLDIFREHSKGWMAKLILALITVPFALWGIDSYLQQAGSNVAVAEVDGQNISVQEYENARQKLFSQLQAAGKVDPALLEDPEVKKSVVDKLVMTQLLSTEVREKRFALADESLGKFIITLPEFQQDGKFSQELYDRILSQNKMTPTQFEARMRHELLVQQAREGVAAAAFVPQQLFDGAIRIEHQQREVSVADIKAEPFLAQVKVEPSQVRDYYEKNKEKFRVPEQVRIEYLMFSANNLIAGMQVTDDEAKKYYAENASKFQGDEQRRASHILIGFSGKSDAASKKAAQDKAHAVLAEIRKSPEKFAELAKKYSQDPGSAQNGGDLGVFGRGMMVKPFEDAVFSMAPGAISDLVESEFGYHIIKLTEINGQGQTYDEVKANIRAELMYQKSLARFAEQAEAFSNIVYEQSDSLAPAAKEFGLQVQTSQWMSRTDAARFFRNDKLASAIFSDEVLKNKRNSEVIEAAANTLVSARMIEHKPSAARSFAEVSPAIEQFLRQQQALAMAGKKGADLLTNLRQGKGGDDLEWIPPVVIDRKNAQGLSDAVMKKAFAINTEKLPAFDGVENKGVGYSLIRVTRVEGAAPSDMDERKLALDEMQEILAEEYMTAYLEALRGKANIKINQKLLETASRQ